MTRSDPATVTMSGYRFPTDLRVGELLPRAPTSDDIPAIPPAFRDPAVGGEAGLPPVDAETLRTMLHDPLLAMQARGLLSPYVIEDTADGPILGGTTLHHFDSMRDVVEVGSWLFVDARGRGVATRSVGEMVEDAFANGICRVEAHVCIGNVASERVLERLGLEREDVKLRLLRHGGVRVDATLFARVSADA